MTLHRLASVTIGVPNVADTQEYYAEFGLASDADGWLRTSDGGRQLCIVDAPTRRLLEARIAVDDGDDLDRAARGLAALEVPVQRGPGWLAAVEQATGVRAVLSVMPRLVQTPTPAPVYNAPGSVVRDGARAPGVLRTGRVRPRKLGHAVVGTTNFEATFAFFVSGLGFRLSDRIKDAGAFVRCSSDHHNMLILAAPVSFLHHTSWQVDDVDEVGRGASAMLGGHPERHVWGLGRHHAGSNFFWYLKDPAGNFSEYYSDMDTIGEDQLWTPEVFEGAQGLFNWGPPPPPSFLAPDDLGALMTGSHTAR